MKSVVSFCRLHCFGHGHVLLPLISKHTAQVIYKFSSTLYLKENIPCIVAVAVRYKATKQSN